MTEERTSFETAVTPGSDGAPRMLPVTARAVAIGLLLIPANAWWITQIEYVRYSDNATTSALFFNAIGLLVILRVLNGLARRIAPRYCFTRAELLTIYVIVVVASCLGGHDQLQILFTTLTYVFRNATPENAWADVIHPLLPQNVLVTSPSAIDQLYLGGVSIYNREILGVWWKPLLWWCSYAFAISWTMLCMSAILRRQWDAERLNYPITEPPLELTDPQATMLRQPVLWVGAALAAIIQLMRLANTLWPSVPALQVGVRNYYFRSAPWNATGAIPISSYPFAYGLAYLLPLQLTFSVWFFFWFSRLEMVITRAAGYTEWGRFPFVQQQGFGAYMGVAVFVIWVARRHLLSVWRHAIGRGEGLDRDEPLPYAWALWGFIGGFAAIVLFSMNMGMRFSTALVYYVILLATVMTVARLRGELGLPTIELYQVGVDDVLQRVTGARAWSKHDLTVMSLNFWLTRTHRQFPMQSYVDAFRLADRCPMPKRQLAGAIIAATFLAVVAAFWAFLHVTYDVGFESAKFRGPAGWAFGNAPWQKLQGWLLAPRDADPASTIAYVFGFCFTLFLASMRTRFLWWPFHPVGYLVSGSFGLFRLWLPIFVTWLVKTLILRYGGLDWYRKARPFFFGLIFGEFLVAFIRTLVDLALGLYLPPTSGIGGL
jgi:hypothetical protein